MSHHSSKSGRAKWLAKRKQDRFAVQARKEGFASRATYKLIAIQEKTAILQRGNVVLDIGAAPGGWSQYVAGVLRCNVIAVDLNIMNPIDGVTAIQGDIFCATTQQRIHEAIAQLRTKNLPQTQNSAPPQLQSQSQPQSQPQQPEASNTKNPRATVDVVICDACVTIRGIANIDAIAQSVLTEDIIRLTPQLLNIGGAIVVKMFHGAEQETIRSAKTLFDKVIHIKPPASRLESREVYLVAMGLREKI